MAGYSQTPLLQKLGIKHGTRLALVHAPDDFAATLGALPPGVELVPVADGADVIVAFPTSRAEVEGLFLELKPKLAFSGGLWIAWPKKSSGIATDLSEDPIREIGLAAGLVDNKVCAIDERWSGLRFVYRLSDRPKR